MDKTMNAAPSGVRTHIGFFGRMNAGKSSLINALTGQQVSIVAPEAGTTTDVVRKPMEIHGIGPCVLLDTAGFDDAGNVGAKRVAASLAAAETADIAVILLGDTEDWAMERQWAERFARAKVPTLLVLGHADARTGAENAALSERARQALGKTPYLLSTKTQEGLDAFRAALIDAVPHEPPRQILGDLVSPGDVILLVMPQDPQAPEGRLILPQVQTIREALDRHCLTLCVQTQELPAALRALRQPPALIVTDSQAFEAVYPLRPEGTRLTSFSVLFAALKGDVDYAVQSVRAIERLNESSRVLIAECCTHAPMNEDIGRIKIPRMLRARIGQGLRVDIAAGADFPEDVGTYDLIIQCGACMFNRNYVMSRTRRAQATGIPMTNYGITMAYLQGILDRVDTGRKENHE